MPTGAVVALAVIGLATLMLIVWYGVVRARLFRQMEREYGRSAPEGD